MDGLLHRQKRPTQAKNRATKAAAAPKRKRGRPKGSRKRVPPFVRKKLERDLATARALLAGTRDGESHLSLLRGQETKIVRKIYSYVCSPSTTWGCGLAAFKTELTDVLGPDHVKKKAKVSKPPPAQPAGPPRRSGREKKAVALYEAAPAVDPARSASGKKIAAIRQQKKQNLENQLRLAKERANTARKNWMTTLAKDWNERMDANPERLAAMKKKSKAVAMKKKKKASGASATQPKRKSPPELMKPDGMTFLNPNFSVPPAYGNMNMGGLQMRADYWRMQHFNTMNMMTGGMAYHNPNFTMSHGPVMPLSGNMNMGSLQMKMRADYWRMQHSNAMDVASRGVKGTGEAEGKESAECSDEEAYVDV